MRTLPARAFDLWETWWRDVLLVQLPAAATGPSTKTAPPTDCLEEGKMYRPAEMSVFLQSLLNTREMMQANVDPQLALENLTMDLPRP